MPHIKALDKAKIALMSKTDSTFFTTVCFSLKHVWDSEIPTACTNGTEIRYNPNFFMSLNEHERVFLLIHESMHVALLHMARLQGRNFRKWNIAADYCINGMLVERGFKMPARGLYDKKYLNLSTEQIYDLLPDEPTEEVDEDLVAPEGDLGPMEEGIKEILVRASVASKMAGDKPGSIPGDIEIYLQKLLKPKLPWQVILRRFVQSLSKDDYTFRQPNRRFFPKHILPGLENQKLSTLAIAVDTSASVRDEEFLRFISEIFGILKMMKPDRIDLIQFDTKVKSVDSLKSPNDISEVKFVGRGGTKIKPVLQWTLENKPQLLIVFTDGYFSWPEETLKTPTLWLIHDNPAFEAPFGNIIKYEI